MRHMRLHRNFCQLAFFALLAAIIIRWLPWLVYVYQHKQADDTPATPLDYARIAVGVLVFAAAGLMRRGPLLRYTPPKLGTGFGISGDMYNTQMDPAEPNVLDWEGSPMLGYVTLSFVSL